MRLMGKHAHPRTAAAVLATRPVGNLFASGGGSSSCATIVRGWRPRSTAIPDFTAQRLFLTVLIPRTADLICGRRDTPVDPVRRSPTNGGRRLTSHGAELRTSASLDRNRASLLQWTAAAQGPAAKRERDGSRGATRVGAENRFRKSTSGPSR
jgi:hypothetical protein